MDYTKLNNNKLLEITRITREELQEILDLNVLDCMNRYDTLQDYNNALNTLKTQLKDCRDELQRRSDIYEQIRNSEQNVKKYKMN